MSYAIYLPVCPSLAGGAIFSYLHPPQAHHVNSRTFIVDLLLVICNTVLMYPLVHSPAPSSADCVFREDPRPAPNSPEPESKKRKRANENPISRCELCKQRKVRLHIFVSCYMLSAVTFTPASISNTVGNSANVNKRDSHKC